MSPTPLVLAFLAGCVAEPFEEASTAATLLAPPPGTGVQLVLTAPSDGQPRCLVAGVAEPVSGVEHRLSNAVSAVRLYRTSAAAPSLGPVPCDQAPPGETLYESTAAAAGSSWAEALPVGPGDAIVLQGLFGEGDVEEPSSSIRLNLWYAVR